MAKQKAKAKFVCKITGNESQGRVVPHVTGEYFLSIRVGCPDGIRGWGARHPTGVTITKKQLRQWSMQYGLVWIRDLLTRSAKQKFEAQVRSMTVPTSNLGLLSTLARADLSTTWKTVRIEVMFDLLNPRFMKPAPGLTWVRVPY